MCSVRVRCRVLRNEIGICRYNKENIPSRAYIAFKNAELLATFSQAYDGHVFRDKAGTESRAVVEFAPFQKVPTEKKKADARVVDVAVLEERVGRIAVGHGGG